MRSLLVIVLAACGGTKPAPTPSNKAVPSAAPAPTSTDPYKSATWIKQLDDPGTRERALQELEQLGDPAAIDAIGKVFLEERSVRPLQVIVSLARPLTPADARAKFITDYETTGRPNNWPRALPFLVRALTEMDPANARSVDAATKAADALGESQLAEAVEPLLAIARTPATKKVFQAQIAAIRSLGKLTSAKAAAAAGLTTLIDVEPPRHPRTAVAPGEGRQLEETFGIHLARVGAAINALAELRVATTKPLILAMYRTPELATQIRRALVGGGAATRDALVEVLAGKHAAVEQLFATKKLGRYCGDLGDAPCQPVSLHDFYPALILGDLHDPRATPALLAALQRPAVPAYYNDEQAGPTQHVAIFDALRKLGSPDAAAPLLAIWSNPKTDVSTRASAMEAYGFVVRGTAGARDLATIAIDNNADDSLRVAAAATLARISTDKADIAVFLTLAQKYLDAAGKKGKEAARGKVAADAADKVFERAKQVHERAKQALVDVARDPKTTADQVRAQTEVTKRAEEAFKLAKKKHREATAPYRQAEQASKAYVGFARMFQTHAARIGVAVRCAGKLDCYAATLALDMNAAAQNAAPYLKDLASWSTDEKVGLLEAEIERAMLELGKAGPAAAMHTPALLDAASSDNRIIRQSVLLALPKIAKLPCAPCVVKLDAAIKAGEGKVTLGELTLETTLLRSYFMQ